MISKRIYINANLIESMWWLLKGAILMCEWSYYIWMLYFDVECVQYACMFLFFWPQWKIHIFGRIWNILWFMIVAILLYERKKHHRHRRHYDRSRRHRYHLRRCSTWYCKISHFMEKKYQLFCTVYTGILLSCKFIAYCIM